MVFTETLIKGTSGVGVKVRVGVSVGVGVAVGGSGENVVVAVGVDSKVGDKAAVSVSPAMTVWATVVLRASMSDVATLVGSAHATLAINNTITGK